MFGDPEPKGVHAQIQNQKPDGNYMDIVHLQNEMFSRLFVGNLEKEYPQENDIYPTLPLTAEERGDICKKSSYPRTRLPAELKDKFDMVNLMHDYND